MSGNGIAGMRERAAALGGELHAAPGEEGGFRVRARLPEPDTRLNDLTEREREVLVLVGEGLTNEEIAERLVLSPATAKTHVSRTMVKLRARDRAQLVVIGYETGLVTPGWFE